MRLLGALNVLLLAASPAAAQAPADSGVIAGVIEFVDSTGVRRPAVGVGPFVGGRELWRRSDSLGRFTLSRPAGNQRLLIAGPRYFNRARAWITVPAGDTVRVRLTVSLHPAYATPRVLAPERLGWLDWHSLREMEMAAGALGAPKILSEPLQPGVRELWIWTEFGYWQMNRFLRIRDDGESVTGDIVAYSSVSPADSVPWYIDRRIPCDVVRFAPFVPPLDSTHWDLPLPAGVEACIVRTDSPPYWQLLLRQLEEHRVWTLPDDSVFPLDATVTFDGWGVYVIARDGSDRSAYQYSNPDPFHPFWQEPRDASAIARILHDEGLLYAPDAGCPLYSPQDVCGHWARQRED